MAREPAHAAQDSGDDRTDGRIVRSATEARQGEIVLGRRGRGVWSAAFVAALSLFAA
jgi:hypothetical protein